MKRLIPVLSTVAESYQLLWRTRRLHAKAIWPPIFFLVIAEVCYHKIFNGGDSTAKIWATLQSAPWYWLAGLALCWLLGLKFLVSFSVSWRRHLLLGEAFNVFYFKKPFWKYLGFLVVTYLWMGIGLTIASLPFFPVTCTHIVYVVLGYHWSVHTYMIIQAFTLTLLVWFLIRQTPYFTSLTVDEGASWATCFHRMYFNEFPYALTWVLTMAPLFLFTYAVGQIVHALGFDVATVPVALFESVIRQAVLFLHIALGTSIGALVYKHLEIEAAKPDEPATEAISLEPAF